MARSRKYVCANPMEIKMICTKCNLKTSYSEGKLCPHCNIKMKPILE